MQKRMLLTGFFVLSTALLSHAQPKSKKCPGTDNKKAESYFEKARDARKDHKPFKVVRELIFKAFEEDSAYAQAWLYLGDMAYSAHDDKTMAMAYEHLIPLCPDGSPEAYYRLGNYQYEEQDFDKAIANLQSFLDFNKVQEDNARDAAQKIARAQIMKHPVPFNPVKLDHVSGGDPEYLAVISPDQDICFFTRRFEEQKRGQLTPSTVEKFMISHKQEDGTFDTGEPMPLPFNKAASNNEGAATISIDNRRLYFTVNKADNFEIYTSEENNGEWSDPVSAGTTINSQTWEGQPCLSSDGKLLLFTSFRDSVNPSNGNIYQSKKGADGKWSAAVPLPAPINTTATEKTPFLHPDKKTLYFSSNREGGMGGFDIYFSRLQNDGSWSTPKNIGYPINTTGDEAGFFVSTDGKKGFFASNNIGNGGYDIFSFDMPEAAKPERVLFIKGNLSDENDEPVNASIELKNTFTRETLQVDLDTMTGKYASVVSFSDDYIMTVKKQGYAYTSAYFSKDDTTLLAPRKTDLIMRKMEVGASYPIRNILFESNSSALNRQDSVIIDGFAAFLVTNPSLKVAIHGHTDNSGSPTDNQALSQERAKAVFEYLSSKGIVKTRLSYQGFGETKPVAANTTQEGKARNRRTEFVILAK